ncbi:HD domain-containing protein [Gemmatimonadota bacterium]
MRTPLPSLFILTVASAVAPGGASAQGNPADSTTLADALIPEMERVFADTPGMIDHTRTVLGHALDIHEQEGGNLTVVRASAILHDIGIPRAREVHGSSAGPYQEIEGPPIAREILTRHRFPPDQIDHICGIVANHHSAEDPRIVTTVEFKILWDADWLVNFPGRYRNANAQEKAAAIEEIFKTRRGKQLALEMFLGQGGVSSAGTRSDPTRLRQTGASNRLRSRSWNPKR